MEVVLALIVFIILAYIWISQFVILMSLSDDMFFGPHDKILWCAAFIVISFLTPFAFMLWRRVRFGDPMDAEPENPSSD